MTKFSKKQEKYDRKDLMTSGGLSEEGAELEEMRYLKLLKKIRTIFAREIIEFIAAIEKDNVEGVTIEIETVMDNVLPCEYTPDEINIFEDIVRDLAHDGIIRIIDNCSVQKVRW